MKICLYKGGEKKMIDKINPEINCDTCGLPILTIADGWVEFRYDEERKICGFQIVHHQTASRRMDIPNCDYPSSILTGSYHLRDVLSHNGVCSLMIDFDKEHSDYEEKNKTFQAIWKILKIVMKPEFLEHKGLADYFF